MNKVFSKAVERCQKSLYMECYAIDYLPLLEKIKAAIDRGVKVEIYYDPKASLDLKKFFYGSKEGSNPILRAYKGKALMHRKLFIEDGEIVYTGSANFTKGSLLYHENAVVGLKSKALADYLQRETPVLKKRSVNEWNFREGGFTVESPQFRARFFKLPEEKFAALSLLYDKLKSAKKTIDVAMFTFTHHKIAEVLKERSLAGVKVNLVLDNKQFTLSKKISPSLEEAGVQIKTYKPSQLFHHKWALIDGREWIFGTVNWTKNGFSKNSELIAFFEIYDPMVSKELTELFGDCANF